jgi:putative transposase
MSYYKLFYHLVWATYRRYPVLVSATRDAVYGTIITKATKLGAYVHALNGIEDHVHLVVTIPPTIALSNFIGQIKGTSSRMANAMPREIHEPFGWQDEFGALSFSERDLPAVVRYVQLQQQHHASNTLNERLEHWE